MGRLSMLRGAAAAVVALAVAEMATPASAFVIGFGFPYPGFYAGPWPYYPAPSYYPYYYPQAYYYPPPAAYYPPAAEAPTGSAAAPPGIAGEPLAPPATTSPYAPATAAITYTDRPAFRNGAGQTCREYRMASGARGTACQDAGGQWRVAD
jgi:hypothetical protein